MSPRFIILFIFSLILLFDAMIRCPVLLASENIKQEELLYAVKNHDALLEDRKAALKQLSDNPTDAFRKTLIELLQSQKESRVLQQFIAQTVITMKDPEFSSLLKKTIADKKADSYLRQVSISILWKQNPESILPLMLGIAQDSFETFFIRSKTMPYLAPIATKSEVKDVMIKIFNNPEESPKIKKLAFEILEKSKDRTLIQNIYQNTATDQQRNLTERREALKKVSANVREEDLLKILDDKNENSEAKKLAIQELAGQEKRLPVLLPQLKRLERMGPLVGIDKSNREDLQNLIDKIESDSKTNQR